jgi:hypothetical protein
MSYDGARKARNWGLEQQPFGLNGIPCRRHRFAVEADRPQREPAKDWRRNTGSHGSVIDPLDTVRHQRFSGAAEAARAEAAATPLA